LVNNALPHLTMNLASTRHKRDVCHRFSPEPTDNNRAAFAELRPSLRMKPVPDILFPRRLKNDQWLPRASLEIRHRF